MKTKSRYEIQQYDWRKSQWYPVYVTNLETTALRRLTSAVKKGYYTRIVDGLTKAVVEAGRPKAPKYECEACADSGECIIDSADHNGEHVQTVLPCECTL